MGQFSNIAESYMAQRWLCYFDSNSGWKEYMNQMKDSKISRLLVLVFVPLCSLQWANGQKLKAEEIISRHVEAMGGAETLRSVTTRVVGGTVVATFREPGTGQVGGRVVLASEGPKNVIAMIFDNATNYPHEKAGFDGKDVSISYASPGVRSTLGDFLWLNKGIVKHGVWGGVLSQAWPLLDTTKIKSKVESGGTKKIGDRLTHQLKVYPSGVDVRITLFFDAETFDHVRTEYTRTIAAQMGGTPETSTRESETRYKIVEDFGDFKKEGGLTLPHSYKIFIEVTNRSADFKADWAMTLSEFQFNQRIDSTMYDVDDRK